MTAVIYSRVSSTSDRQNTDRQILDLTSYANAMQYSLDKNFSEKISGGVKNSERNILNECISYCIENNVDIILISELSRLGRNVLELQEVIKILVDNKINLYSQKEMFTLLDDNKELSMFAPVMLATLATCASIERDNIKFRLNSGRNQYIANGGKLGRSKGSNKDVEVLLKQHADIVKLLKTKLAVRKIATLTGKSATTVQKIKKILDL